MKINKIFLMSFMFLGSIYYAQDSIKIKTLSQYPQDQLSVDEYGNKYYYDKKQKAKIYDINGETVIVMDELVLSSFNKVKFNNQLDRNYYYFLNKKLNRVYPLFVKALQQYRDIQDDLDKLDKKEQRQFAKQKQNELADQYEAQLRDLTTTEGKVFAKLMYRSTGKSVFEIIKELRGSWSAFWWNVKGNIADVDLKDPYDPRGNRSDLFIESLLQKNWQLGYLEPYPGHDKFYTKKKK